MPDFAGTHLLCEREKSETRSKLLNARREIFATPADAALVVALERLIEPLVATRSGTPGRPIVAAYVPMAGEPGGCALPSQLAAALGPGRLILPVLRDDLDLDWAGYTGDHDLAPPRRGMREPIGDRLGRAAIAAADLVIAPAVAVDQSGVRLGRGGGSYDRALARVPAHVEIVVPLYAGEFLPRLPQAPHDTPVTTALVADGGTVRVFDTRRGRSG